MKSLKDYEYFRTENGVLYCGDNAEILPLIADNSIDLILTDPPYGIGLEYDIYNDNLDNWKNLMVYLVGESKRIAQMTIMPSCQIKELKWIYENIPPDWLIAWYKGSPGHRAFVGFNDWEPHLVYGKIKGLQMHDYFQTKPSEKNINHPCPKSIDYAIKLLTMTKAKIVLDCFMGSGTLAIASEKLNIKWIGIEIS